MPNTIYQKFFKDKSIQKADKFLVTIIPNDLFDTRNSSALNIKAQKLKLDLMPDIKQYHVTNITVPRYTFTQELINEGVFKRSFPVFEHKPFEVSVLFDEDHEGTIGRFINWSQRRLFDENGVYYSNRINRIGTLLVEILDDQDNVIYNYRFNDIYYVNSQPITYDYSQSVAMKYSINFGCDFVEFEEVKLRS